MADALSMRLPRRGLDMSTLASSLGDGSRLESGVHLSNGAYGILGLVK
jgi:hypothetical protein